MINNVGSTSFGCGHCMIGADRLMKQGIPEQVAKSHMDMATRAVERMIQNSSLPFPKLSHEEIVSEYVDQVISVPNNLELIVNNLKTGVAKGAYKALLESPENTSKSLMKDYV